MRETGLMLKGLLILASCAASALALSVAVGVVPLDDVLSVASDWSCEAREAFQLEPCHRFAVSQAAAPRVVPSGARSDAPAPKSPVDKPPSDPSRAPKPWDDPKWDDMVASKHLEILLKVPDDG